jgi:hypothetical protein
MLSFERERQQRKMPDVPELPPEPTSKPEVAPKKKRLRPAAGIPSNAADLTPPSDPVGRDDLERLEFELLETDRALRTLQKREAGQRYWLRWIAVGAGVLVILGMSALLTHLVHQTFWGPFHFASGAFSVAMIVAPIASITAITVALFVGAFRKFEDKDMEAIGNGAAGAFNSFRG